MPLDSYVEHPIIFMDVLPEDPYVPIIWEEYREIVRKHEKAPIKEEAIDKFQFYDRAKKAYAVVTTSETALYANVILKKGVIIE